MTSTDTLGRLHRVCTRRRSLTGWFFDYPPFRTSLSLSDLHIYIKVLHNVTPFVAIAINGGSIFQQSFRFQHGGATYYNEALLSK